MAKYNKDDFIQIKDIASELGISYITAWKIRWVQENNVTRYGVSKSIAIPKLEEFKNNQKIASTYKPLYGTSY